jgi:MoxR-like ATPase
VVAVFAHRVAINGRYSSTVKKSEQAEQMLRELVETIRVPA